MICHTTSRCFKRILVFMMFMAMTTRQTNSDIVLGNTIQIIDTNRSHLSTTTTGYYINVTVSDEEEPGVWYITDRHNLREILQQDVYQEYQWSLLEGFHMDTEWSYWTYCAACLRDDQKNASVQLRYRVSVEESSIQARNCTTEQPEQPLCPDISYRGLWYHNKVVKDFLIDKFDDPPVYLPFYSDDTTEDNDADELLELRYHKYKLEYCSLKIKQSGGAAKYIVMAPDGCYGSNRSDIFNYGIDTRDYGLMNPPGRMEVYVYADCPNYCYLVESSGLCLCYFYAPHSNYTTSLASQSDAISMCSHENSIILPTNYSAYAAPFVDTLQPGGVWLSYGPHDELSYTCKNYTTDRTLEDAEHCDPNNSYQVICLYNDDVQYEWTQWSEWSSCSAACGGGWKNQRRYKLSPQNPGESVAYTPRRDWIHSRCNEEPCPWYNSTNHTVPELYPKWAGCWLSNAVKSLFLMHEEDLILDGDQFNRREFVEKCAIATQGVGNAFAVKKRLCFVGNISSVNDYNSTGASYACDRHGRTSGNGFDIYLHTNESVDPQWGPFYTAHGGLGSCSLACGGGVKTQIRDCNNPPPVDNNVLCSGNMSRESDCNTNPCPEPFGYSNIGCYQATYADIVINHPLLDGVLPGQRRDSVRKCALVAHEVNAPVFGLVHYGHCVISSDLHCRYRRFNSVPSDCYAGMGGSTAINMYILHYGNGTAPTSFEDCEILMTTTDMDMSTDVPDLVAEELESQVQEILNQNSVSLEETSEALTTLENTISDQDLTSKSIEAATDLLTALADKLIFNQSDTQGANNGSAVLLDEMAAVVDLLTREGQQDAWAASGDFTSLLTSVEAITLKSASSPHSGGSSRVAISIQLLDSSDYMSSGYSSAVSDDVAVSIYLPPEVFSQHSVSDSAEQVSMVTVAYKDVSGFIGEPIIDEGEKLQGDANYSRSRMSDAIISLKLGTLNSDTRLTNNIKLSIPISLNENETKAEDSLISCVFWNETASYWSADGCETTVAADWETVDCHCNHLTSFGVLMKFTDYDVSEKAEEWLKHIFYIGCSISLLCLIATFIIFVYLDNLKTDRKKIHMNLIVALGLAQITHVVGIGLTSDPATCMCIAILLHLLYTATFTWMLCEGIHLYHKVIAVFETEGKGKKILYYIIGWGVPVMIVAVSAGIRHDGYGRDDFCWLAIKDEYGNHDGLIWAFIGPVCLVILINFGIMVAVMRVVVRSAVSVVPREKRNLQTVKAGVKSVLILTPILGVNWIFGLLAVNKKLTVFEFLFVIINSLQGLLIFIFHCVGSSEVRSAFKRKRDQASRSLEPSNDDKNRKRSRLKVSNWFNANDEKKGKHWPPNIFQRPSSGQITPEDTSSDIIDGLVDGRLGRNVGGLKHMVVTPATPDSTGKGRVNGAFQREDSTLSNLSSKLVWHAPPHHTTYSGASTKFSISTVTTSLGDSDCSESRRSSGSAGSCEELQFSNSALSATESHQGSHNQRTQHLSEVPTSHKHQTQNSPSSHRNELFEDLGDINELEDIEDYET